MFGVRNALEEPVGGMKKGNGDFRPIEILRQPRAVPLAGFAEKYGANGTGRAQRFFHQTRAFHSDRAGFCWQAATQRHAKLLEPLVVARSNQGWWRSGRTRARRF
jgi:hypothetical protein